MFYNSGVSKHRGKSANEVKWENESKGIYSRPYIHENIHGEYNIYKK